MEDLLTETHGLCIHESYGERIGDYPSQAFNVTSTLPRGKSQAR